MNRVWRVAAATAAGAMLLALAAAAAAQESPASGMTETEILSFLESRVPGALDMLMAVRDNDPEAYHKQLQELGEQITYYRQVRERSPEYAESLLRAQYVTLRTQALSDQIHGMDAGEERDRLVAELRGLLKEQFDLQLEQPQIEVESLEQEVSRLKQRIEQQRESRDAIVELRLQSLTGEKLGQAP